MSCERRPRPPEAPDARSASDYALPLSVTACFGVAGLTITLSQLLDRAGISVPFTPLPRAPVLLAALSLTIVLSLVSWLKGRQRRRR